MTGQLLRSGLLSLTVLCSGSSLVSADALNSLLGPDDPGKLPLVQKAVLLDGITDALAIYPEFGRFSESPGNDLLLGYQFKNVKGEDCRGRLKVFQNRGTLDRPHYAKGFWFDEQNSSARVPDG